MERIRKLSHKYYFKPVLACWLIFSMLAYPVQVALADINPAAGALPNGIIESMGINTPAIVGNNMAITQTANEAIVRWNNFDIGKDASVTFNQPGAHAAILNRIQDASGTGIMGALNANGKVFIINPAGIVFGAGACVNVSQLVASSSDLTNQDFLNHIYNFAIPGTGAVVNKGKIIAQQGAALIGQMVRNTGTITTGNNGFVVMAAGDKVLLGETGSKILVQMSSATGPLEDVGHVINDGSINSPNGKVVLAAGDIYSIPLHPQLQVNSGTTSEPVYTPEDQPERVETGMGTVTQNGTINANGSSGEVVLTAGDTVRLSSTSNTNAVNGKITAYAYDFKDTSATTYFDQGAEASFGKGSAQITGNHVLLRGSIDADSGSTVQIASANMTIAEKIPTGGAAIDTVYKDQIEYLSQEGINLDLAGDELITVDYMNQGILGGKGNVGLRNVFDTGGINFVENPCGKRTSITTKGGGDISMYAGSGGILAGDLETKSTNGNPICDPGQISLYTNNGGNIETGNLYVGSGNKEIISVVSDGDIKINGDVTSYAQEVPDSHNKSVSAEICLKAKDSVNVDGDITLNAHGKDFDLVKLHVDAGTTVKIDGKITANSDTSGLPTSQCQTSAESIVQVHAGGVDDCGKEAVDIADGVDARAKIYGQSDYSASSSGDAGDNVNMDRGHSGNPAQYDPLTGLLVNGQHILIEIKNNYDISGCKDCLESSILPPVPHVFFIADDLFDNISWRAGNLAGFNAEALDVLLNDNGIKYQANVSDEIVTSLGGKLQRVLLADEDGQPYWGYRYTPPTDVQFTWDGSSDFATFTDTFTYKAEKNGQFSANSATVTLIVKNFLPTVTCDSQTIHMNTPANPTDAKFNLSMLVSDFDSTPGNLDVALGNPVFGDSTHDCQTVTYTPYQGYVGDDSFNYKIKDSSINYNCNSLPSAKLNVEVTNKLPGGEITLEDAHMNAVDQTLGIASGAFTDCDDDVITIANIDKATDDENKYFGGTLVDNADATFDYTADQILTGYVGEDDFDARLWDGQYDYQLSDTPLDGYELFKQNCGAPDIYRTKVYGSGTINVEVTNTLPNGTIQLQDAHMNAVDQTLGIANGSFADPDHDAISVDNIVKANNDYNKTFGGTLIDNADGTFDYTSDSSLPGYVGPDDFHARIWDGQYDYKTSDTPLDGYELFIEYCQCPDIYRAKVYGCGTIDVPVTNILPGGTIKLQDAHMNAVDQTLAIAGGRFSDEDGDNFAVNNIVKSNNDYNKTFGGTLIDNTDGTYNYTSDSSLPSYVGEDDFTAKLWDGQIDYSFKQVDGKWVVDCQNSQKVYGCGNIDVELTNNLPDGTITLEDAHMNAVNQNLDVASGSFHDGDNDNFVIDNIVKANDDENKTFGGTLSNNADGSFNYTSDPELPGYVGEDDFTAKLWDGQIDYSFRQVDGQWVVDCQNSQKVYGCGTIDLKLTNTLPTATGNLGKTTVDTILIVPQTGTTSPVAVSDLQPDNLSIIPNSYTGSSGGQLVFDGSKWTYTPAAGFTGQEVFEINVSDGQNDYTFLTNPSQTTAISSPKFGNGTVVVSVDPTSPPITPPISEQGFIAPPLQDYKIPRIEGCPAEMRSVALELGISFESVQVVIGRALALDPAIQPCEACRKLMSSAEILKDPDGSRLAAMVQTFNMIAPADVAFTPEISASVQTAFAGHIGDGTTYAQAAEYIDALVRYIAVLDTELGSPVGDSTAFALEKYGTPIINSDNPNLGAFVQYRLENKETFTQPINIR